MLIIKIIIYNILLISKTNGNSKNAWSAPAQTAINRVYPSVRVCKSGHTVCVRCGRARVAGATCGRSYGRNSSTSGKRTTSLCINILKSTNRTTADCDGNLVVLARLRLALTRVTWKIFR